MKEKTQYIKPFISWFNLEEDVLTISNETSEYNMGWFADELDAGGAI